MSKEKNLKWHFGPAGGQDVGPNDPIHQNFKGNPYYYIVREAIQNSMDAVMNKDKPVEVHFDFIRINRLEGEFPKLFEIENYIESCKNYFPDNRHAERMFEGMEKYLEFNGNMRTTIPCLKISDYNTKGMPFSNDTKSPFYAFMRAAGVSAKTGASSGGSFGFGKGAYFALSALKTVLASTYTEDGEYFFEGTTRLTTHLDKYNDRKTAYGYYNAGKGKPVSNLNEIPDDFLREKVGTDFIIIGRQEENYRVPMIKSVLNNFWLAILKNRLSVKVDNEIINKENLDKKINEYFDSEVDKSSVNNYEKWNPKSYYKAVHYKGKNEKFNHFSERLSTVGNVNFYVYLADGLSNKICFLRKPNMVVYKETSNKLNGYSGVFVCEDSIGDEILMEMENPAHNEWHSSNYLKLDESKHPDGEKAKKEINSFVRKCLEELAAGDIGSSTTVLGLDEYLNIPEDLIGDKDYDGAANSTDYGRESNERSKDETGSITTEKTDHKIKTIRNKPEKKAKQKEETKIDEEGDLDVTVGVDKDGNSKTGDPHPNNGDQVTKGSEGDSAARKLVNITYRVVAQEAQVGLKHVLLITSKINVSSVQLDLLAGNDQGNSRNGDNAKVIYADKGSVSGSTIKQVDLVKGLNKVTIQFDDNLKHSIGVKAYEVR